MMTYDPEAIYQDADIEQAEFEAEGRDRSRRYKKSKALRAAGKLAEAADVCPHGSGYPTQSLAAKHEKDPREGQFGFRCTECGSWWAGTDDSDNAVISGDAPAATVPCELSGRD